MRERRADEVLGSAAIYGSPAQYAAVRSVGNTGTKPATIQVGIFGESGEALPVLGNCNQNPLPAGNYCESFADITPGVAFACSIAVTSGSGKNLRATLDLIDSGNITIRSTRVY